MKRMTRRVLALLLTVILIVGMVPASVLSVFAATYYSNAQISGAKNTVLSNKEASAYVNAMMAYYLKNDQTVVEENLKAGQSVVFFFDGCSDNVFKSGFDYKTNHRSAYVAVVKLVNGVPKIVYESENGTTIPDNPRDRNLNHGGYYGYDCDDVPVVKDGVHNIFLWNHPKNNGSYAALRIATGQKAGSGADVIRCTNITTKDDISYGINIHARGSDSVRLSTGLSNASQGGSRNSTGCFNVGLASDGWKEYNDFIYAITGKKDAYNSKHSGTNKVGVVIVDRMMYYDQLVQIYGLLNDGDDATATVDRITAYSKNLVKNVSISGVDSGISIIDLLKEFYSSAVNGWNKVKELIFGQKSNQSSQPDTQYGYVSRSTSAEGIEFIKQFEGYRDTAYQDSGGKWTIGYGHTKGVYRGMTITKAQAEQYIKTDVKDAETVVNSFMKKYNRYISQPQFDALVSFTFNLGAEWANNSDYNMHRYMATGRHTEEQVKETFGAWCNCNGKPLAGLVTRRAKEAALYLYGQYNSSGGNSSGAGTKGEYSYSEPSYSTTYSTGNYVIMAQSGVNVRRGAGTNYGIVTAIPKNTTVAIEQVKGNWGKYSAGWICLDYAMWVSELEPVILVPAAPSLKTTSASNLPVGTAVTVTWNKVADADCYDVYLKNSSGTVVQKSEGVNGNSAAFKLTDAGKYTITAVARNTKYTSGVSNTISVAAHNPSTVSFVDWDGKIISSQTIAYGSSAIAPANPSRYGWSFKRWVGNYANVTSNLTIVAEYERNIYTVTFYDEAGEVLGTKQKVQFESAANAPAYSAPEGYVFLGWDKKFDCIESNLSVRPVIKWGNEDLPVTVLSSTTAVREKTGYTVNVVIRNTPTAPTDGRIIVALKTDDGKLLSMTESAAFHLKEATDKTVEVFMPYDQAATVAEIFVVEKFSTAIPISQVKSMSIDQGTAWTNWSTMPNPDDAYQAESRTEYRYRTKSTTTSDKSSLAGWTKYNTTSVWGSYGSWSAWTDSPIAGTDSRQVETRTVVASTNYKTVYHYYRYAKSEHASTGSYAQSSAYPNLYVYTFDYPLETTTAINGNTRYKWWYNGTNWHGLYAGSPYTTQEVVSYNYKTQYRYRDRSLQYTYYYYKWSDWSSWSTTAATATDTKQVESRTTYRYLANDPALVEDSSGVERTISGYVDTALAGEQAILFIYKVDEASDFTNEYVGQTVIGSDGSYEFTFKLREEPTIKTGGYTVTLGVEGTSTAIYLESIEAPKPSYTVTYKDWDGAVISTQTVVEGEDAIAPEFDPVREGYDFICWNDTATNVRDDLIVSPVYRVRTYTVVFVDWNKETVVLENYEHGQPLVPPEIEAPEDSYSVGWDAVIDGTTAVTMNMVVTAKYEKKTFVVEYLDENGDSLDTIVVQYGDSVVDPDALDNENVQLLGWISEGDTDCVTEDLIVVPLYTFKDTVATPTASVTTGEYDAKQMIALHCETEDAVIYYTLNGEDPLVEGIEYVEPFELSTSSELRFVACAFEKNDSEVARELIAINDGSAEPMHIIEFTGNAEGTAYDSFFVEHGAKLGLSNSDFELQGHDFTGAWYGNDLSSQWDFENDVVTSSLLFCLTWSAKTYTVTFLGYDDEVVDEQIVKYGEEAIAPLCEDVDGYVFVGFDCDDLLVYEDRIITAKYVSENEYVEVDLNKSQYQLLNGLSYTLTATLSDNAENLDYTLLWCSSDNKVVMVSDNGTVTATGIGTANIYVVCVESGSVAECKITVAANINEEITLSAVGVGLDTAGQIRGISATQNTVSNVAGMFANDSLVFVDINGSVLEEDDLVGTGTVVLLMDNETIVDQKAIVITGDMNGDGKINNRDASMIVRYIVNKEAASLPQLTAIDVNGDGYVNNRDASMVSRYLVGKETIS